MHHSWSSFSMALACNTCAKKKLRATCDWLFHLLARSLPSPGYSIWNPWNEYWLRPQPISSSMDIMDSMWNEDGMVVEWSVPHGFHMGSTWISLDSIWNAGISTMDSMEQSIWIPWNKLHSIVILLECQRNNLIWYLITKNSSTIRNWTLGPAMHHMIYW